MSELPDDSDGNALRQLVEDGSDLTKPMEIDFAVDVPDADVGSAMAEKVSHLGFRPRVFYDSDSKSWTCYCKKTIVPTYDSIIAIQNQLDEISRPLGGKSDGWGSFGNADSK